MAFKINPPESMVKFHPIYMIFGQVMTSFKVNPDPDPHFRFLCEHGAYYRGNRQFNFPSWKCSDSEGA